MDSKRIAKISSTYERHPLRAATIIERLHRAGRFGDISEVDLATDDVTLITDQNHTGGLQAVVELARHVGLQPGHRVLDVGTGLGGTPRVLAELFGCRCHGIELTSSRYQDAVELTQLVGLEHLVTLSCGDFLSASFPESAFDIIIGQETFMHFDHLEATLHRCSELLAPEGWLIVEDGFVRRPPGNEAERRQMSAAWDHWNGHFSSLDEWQRALQSCGLVIWDLKDQTARTLKEYKAKLDRLHWFGRYADPAEVAGWELGEALICEGVIGTMRLLCRRLFAIHLN